MRPRGFVLPAVMVMTGLAAVMSAGALLSSVQASALSSRQALRLRAFEAAEGGLARAATVLERTPPPVPPLLDHRREGGGSARVHLMLDHVDLLPAGYSAGAVRAQRWRIRSEGRHGNARVALVAGFTRHVPAP